MKLITEVYIFSFFNENIHFYLLTTMIDDKNKKLLIGLIRYNTIQTNFINTIIPYRKRRNWSAVDYKLYKKPKIKCYRHAIRSENMEMIKGTNQLEKGQEADHKNA